MRKLFLAASLAVLAAACQQQEAANQTAPMPAPNDVIQPANLPPTDLVEKPSTPEEAVVAARNLEAAPAQTPDLTFKDGGADVRVTRDPRNGLRVMEDGRSYFFRPGQDQPFLIRQGDYEYAYRDGRLIGAVDRNGRRIDAQRLAERRTDAERAFARARALQPRAMDPQLRTTVGHDRPDRDTDDPRRDEDRAGGPPMRNDVGRPHPNERAARGDDGPDNRQVGRRRNDDQGTVLAPATAQGPTTRTSPATRGEVSRTGDGRN